MSTASAASKNGRATRPRRKQDDSIGVIRLPSAEPTTTLETTGTVVGKLKDHPAQEPTVVGCNGSQQEEKQEKKPEDKPERFVWHVEKGAPRNYRMVVKRLAARGDLFRHHSHGLALVQVLSERKRTAQSYLRSQCAPRTGQRRSLTRGSPRLCCRPTSETPISLGPGPLGYSSASIWTRLSMAAPTPSSIICALRVNASDGSRARTLTSATCSPSSARRLCRWRTGLRSVKGLLGQGQCRRVAAALTRLPFRLARPEPTGIAVPDLRQFPGHGWEIGLGQIE